MALVLKHGVTFCQVGNRCLFLDVAADRYFCLAPPVEAQFIRLSNRDHPDPAGDPLLEGLVARGLLKKEAGSHVPQPCRAPPLPESSLLDTPCETLGRASVLAALARLALASARLRTNGLLRTLAAISRAKSALSVTGSQDPACARPVAAAFMEAARVATLLDNCLGQSLAISHALLARDLKPDLVVGVQLGPFQAHCWVQLGDRLVNDRFDTVRTFVPILAL